MEKKYNLIQNMFYVLCGVCKYNKWILFYMIVNTFVTAVSPFIGILFPRQILDELLTLKRPDRVFLLLLSFFLASSAASYLAQYLKGVFMAQPVKVTAPCMDKLYHKCMDICFRCTENPEFLNNVQSATKGGGKNNFEGISGMLHKWFETPGMVIALCGYITIISRLNVLISAYLICAVGIHYAFLLAGKRYEHSKRDELAGNERRSKYLYDIMYDFSYGKEIRLYALSEWLGSQFMLYRDKIRTIKKSIKNYEMLVAWIDILLSFIREGIVYAYLVFMVLEGDMTIADFTMYVATIAGFRGAFERTIRQLADMHGLSMQISDYQSFMLWPDEMAEAEKPVPVPDGPYGNVSANSYEFEFRNVSWKYPGSNHYVFRNLNLTISKGQKLAIVGNNGAGKSTFIKLLLRLYDVTEGEILCNGINIRQFERRQYYDIFSAVFQEILPLGFSVADNIGVSDGLQIDRQRVNSCIQRAGLSDKINGLKYGADTCVLKIIDDEGIEFSGGEKQKLMIARALYKNGAVMILDEPAAALDPLAEREIYEKFNGLTENKTTIYVSHRLASTRFCDAIALFENGGLVEYGTHEELMELDKKYAEMFHIQAAYYRQEGERM